MVRKTLCALVATAALTFGGCENKEADLTGTVLKEAGTVIERQKYIESSKGDMLRNKSIRFGAPTYVLKIKADDGMVYTFAVESYGRNEMLDALNESIEVGTKVKIHKGFGHNFRLNGFVGSVHYNGIEVTDNQ